jgi:hypothetical protein
MSVSWDCFVMSDTGLRGGVIICPRSPTKNGVSEYDREASIMRPRPTGPVVP